MTIRLTLCERDATDRQTDRQTDRPADKPTDGIGGDKPVPPPAYALLYYSDVANNNYEVSQIYLGRKIT